MGGFQAAAAFLPPGLRQLALNMPPEEQRQCQELRLRRGRPMGAVLGQGEFFLPGAAVTGEDIRAVLAAASGSSLHAVMGQLCQGFVSAPGGVRVGVCGTGVWTAEQLTGLRDYSSVSLRIPTAVPGCADGIWPELTAGGFSSTLILSPPGGGKTTLLRELVRRLSDSQGLRVALADERGEVADSFSGLPGFDVGARTDVLTGVAKPQAVQMLLRAMNPQVIAMDEVTAPADAQALLTAVGCGVKLLATVHGESLSGLWENRACRPLLEAGVFARCVTVTAAGGVRRYGVEAIG
jgi:stage III sporulation protein AA